MKFLVLCGSPFALAFVQTAAAEVSATPADVPAGAEQSGSGASANGSSSGLADIIVTASRRSESAQRAALAIQAITGEDLAQRGVLRPEDLNAVAPGVNIGTAGNYPQVYVRGVGNYSANSFAEGAVAFNLNGIYVSRPWATRASFFDLDRVEILKGPQGTLYGRNASGGAVNVIYARPKLGSRSGFMEVEAGNYDLLRGTAAVNLPVGDTLAIRASGQIVHRNGYLSDGSDDDKSQAARLQLLYEPDSTFSLLLTGAYQHIEGIGAGGVPVPKISGKSAWTSITDPSLEPVYAGEPGVGPFLTRPTTAQNVNIDVLHVSAEMNWDLGPATLTVIPAYRRGKLEDLHNLTGFQTTDSEIDHQTSVEARLANESAAFKWVVGGFYFDEHQKRGDKPYSLLADIGPATAVLDVDQKSRSYAAFGQATYSLTDALRLTGGLRYTYERKTLTGPTTNYQLPTPGVGCAPPYVFNPGTPYPPQFCTFSSRMDNRRAFKQVSWKAGVEYDVAPNSLLFFNASTGFKSGGFYPAPLPNSFGPEKVLAFELGSKNRFFDNKLQLNLEAFYWKYKGQQQSYFSATSTPGYFTFATVNAGKARIFGVDADIAFRPTDADTFNLQVEYINTKYQEFTITNYTSLGPPVTGCDVGPLSPDGSTRPIDCAGFPLVRTPKWSGTASYSHRFELSSGFAIEPGASVQFASSSWLSVDYLGTERQDAYAMLDASLAFYAPGNQLSLTVFARNLTNEAVITQANRHLFIHSAPTNPNGGADGLIVGSIRAPRTYGARLRYNF
ncbi:Outer membrane receptor protein precursor [Sphingomonas paucimobilis]|nr:Outer membrane receptor protein precursor [Sphingomonas paucimobilis]